MGAAAWVAVVAALVLVLVGVAGGAWWFSRVGTGSSNAGSQPTTGVSNPHTEPSSAGSTEMTPPTTDAPTTAGSTSAATPGELEFSDTYAKVESGVLRIVATTCDGDGIGTGFLLSPHIVATAEHVVNGAAAVSVDGPDGIQSARVMGVDEATDLALLRLNHGVEGHNFSFAKMDATPGTAVAAIGFPLNEPKTLTIGTVSGLDRTINVDGVSRSGLLQTDTAINPGNSGGPLVTVEGEVVGVVDALLLHSQGIGYAVQGSVARPSLLQRSAMQVPPTPTCGTSEAPDQLTVTPRLVHPASVVSSQVQGSLSRYYNAINAGDYDLVIQQYSASFGAQFDSETLARNLATSIDYDAVIQEISGSADAARVWVTFVSVQAPRFGPDGESCTQWSLDYDFVLAGGRFLIDGVQAHTGDGHTPC